MADSKVEQMVCLTAVTMTEMWDYQRAVMKAFPLVYNSAA